MVVKMNVTHPSTHTHTHTYTHLEVLHEVVLVMQDSHEVLAGLPVTAINQGPRKSCIIIMKHTYINVTENTYMYLITLIEKYNESVQCISASAAGTSAIPVTDE